MVIVDNPPIDIFSKVRLLGLIELKKLAKDLA